VDEYKRTVARGRSWSPRERKGWSRCARASLKSEIRHLVEEAEEWLIERYAMRECSLVGCEVCGEPV
jgi:hypothetical protein